VEVKLMLACTIEKINAYEVIVMTIMITVNTRYIVSFGSTKYLIPTKPEKIEILKTNKRFCVMSLALSNTFLNIFFENVKTNIIDTSINKDCNENITAIVLLVSIMLTTP